MGYCMFSGRSLRLACVVGAFALPGLLLAAQPRAKSDAAPAPAEQVELFKAMKDGLVEVKLIPKDSTQSKVLITNKTQKPLSVKLPDVFAGVPVLAQAAGAGQPRQRSSSSSNNNQNQDLGGGMGGMMGGMGGGMGGGGMGMFNIAPEKVGQFDVTTVCLQHGKREPNPKVPYELRPIEASTEKPAVHELCRMLGNGQVSQRAAQVAAWNLNNNMSMPELAAKQLRFADGRSTPYFSPAEIQAGLKTVFVATRMAEERAKAKATKSESQNRSLSEK
jgi:hypothetical protein